MNDSEKAIIRRLGLTGVLGNLALAAFKLAAGLLGQSSALISDSIHSLSDVFATFMAWFGARISRKPRDQGHPYGHERFETLASFTLGLVLAATGFGIGYEGLKSLFSGAYASAPEPGLIALVAAIISIISKEAMYHYTLRQAKILRSPAFVADAWHHRSDAISSIGALAGVAGARMGFPFMDCAASVFICAIILLVAWGILKDSMLKMVDSSCDQAFEAKLARFASAKPGVLAVAHVHSRLFGERAYVEMAIRVDGEKSLREAHEIRAGLHQEIEKIFPIIKHIVIILLPAAPGVEKD